MNKLSGISEIDTETGLSNVFEDEGVYYDCLKVFHDMILVECEKMAKALASEDCKTFIISIHGMKSVLNTIGANKLYERALDLEVMAKNDDLHSCRKHFSDFEEKLLQLYKKLSVVL